MTLTREAILAEPAGDRLDGWIDDYVLGIDRAANTPEKRTRAIFGAICADWSPDDTPLMLAGKICHAVWERSPDSTPADQGEPWPWLQRHGKPWQAALEAHVAAWRAPPSRKWSTEIAAAWEMESELARRRLTVEYAEAMMSLQVGWPRQIDLWDVWHLLHASPWYRCRAALLACCPLSAEGVAPPASGVEDAAALAAG